jgi:hypothetical protein
MKILEEYLLYLVENDTEFVDEEFDETEEQFDPISLGLIAAGVGAASTGLTAARLAAQRRNRKKCIAFASKIDNPEERKKAFVRCYQAGQG